MQLHLVRFLTFLAIPSIAVSSAYAAPCAFPDGFAPASTSLTSKSVEVRFNDDLYYVNFHKEDYGVVSSLEIRFPNPNASLPASGKFYSRPFTSWVSATGCGYWAFEVLNETDPTLLWTYRLNDGRISISHYEIDARRIGVISKATEWLHSNDWIEGQNFDHQKRRPFGNRVYWVKEKDEFYFSSGGKLRKWSPSKQDGTRVVDKLPPDAIELSK